MFKKIPRNVFLLGLVSFLNDIASEMIYPIVPIFITTVLHGSIEILGLIEGIAEATASITKYFFGTISDYLQKRKPFVTGGYSLGALSKILMAIATTWPLVLIARFIDRLGKGLRTAPRDSMLLDSSEGKNKGYIFGFHRACDSLGAVIGPLLALMLLIMLKENIRLTFFLSFIPGMLAVITLVFFIKEKKHTQVKKIHFIKLSLKKLEPRLQIFLGISFIFALGNSSDAFLLLYGKTLGFTTTVVVLTYVLYNISQTLFATPAGAIADKIGAKKVFAMGLFIFSTVYFSFGIIRNPLWFWVLFPLYGLYIAFTDGVSKAYIAEFIKKEESGTYFGMYYTLTAIGNFLASLIGGLLWTVFQPAMTFLYGSVMAFLSFFLFAIFLQ
jgi:MFS family permease